MKPRRKAHTACERFTAWISEEERAALRARADEWESSENYVVRRALREFLGIDPITQTKERLPA